MTVSFTSIESAASTSKKFANLKFSAAQSTSKFDILKLLLPGHYFLTYYANSLTVYFYVPPSITQVESSDDKTVLKQ